MLTLNADFQAVAFSFFLRLTEASPDFQSYFIAFSDKKSFVGVAVEITGVLR